jgi:Acyl-coenzyme A:6-aminopenicillanic acid acyl-transferase
MLRSVALALLARIPVFGLALEGLVLGLQDLAASEWKAATAPAGALTIHQGLAIACLTGDAATIGTGEGRLYGARIPDLLGLMGLQPKLLLARRSAAFQATLAAIPEAARTRITAIAATCGSDPAQLLAANALVDVQCSALVALPTAASPLRVARNMDFFPAKTLGPGTVLSIVRETGCRPYASIGWPGSVAVVSGMNDAGLVACILLNHDGPALPGAEPLGMRIAELLAQAGTVEAAVERFAARPVASSHYVLLADPTTATVVWQERDGLHRDRPTGGWLAASNGPRRGGTPTDERGRCLLALTRESPTRERMRQVLSASYMPALNAQAMVFEPATLSLDLALGTGIHPAAKNDWWSLRLGEVFAQGATAGVRVDTLAPVIPLAHYAE